MSVPAPADTMTYHKEMSPPPHEGQQHTNVCVWCQSSLHNRRAHALPEGPERRLISERISPQKILDGSLVCYTCWVRARSILQRQCEVISEETASSAILNSCVWCLCSLNRRRRHSIPEGPERNEIITRIYPREIPPGGLVCYACWVSARRNVKRGANIDKRREDQKHNHRNVVCASCGISLFRRQTHSLPSGPERDEVAARIYPRELPGHALVCITCWTQTIENVQVQQVNEQLPQPRMETIQLDQFTHTTSSSRNCFVPLCTHSERLRVPRCLRKLILTSQKVFVTENARICNEHKSLHNWEFLDQHEFSNTFTKNEMESMLNLAIDVQEIN
ncbi:unnamed protein product [Parnassius apollo]|uniref:(apollo) hypothetical protein n=1 Tax=Parnassius apollo TaxID=110799 RepID=A0A8S3WVH6_PARAO|nr:unnamed protein product [Parnassius apollo]